MSITGRKANAFQSVENKLSTSYSIFQGKIALQSNSYVAKVFVAKSSIVKRLRREEPRTTKNKVKSLFPITAHMNIPHWVNSL